MDLATQNDADFEHRMFADSLGRIQRYTDKQFAAYNLTPEKAATIRDTSPTGSSNCSEQWSVTSRVESKQEPKARLRVRARPGSTPGSTVSACLVLRRSRRCSWWCASGRCCFNPRQRSV
jgi:hypothetical protein